MNWKEFKEAVEKNGVKEDTEIDHISMMGYDYPEDMMVEFEKDDRVSIY